VVGIISEKELKLIKKINELLGYSALKEMVDPNENEGYYVQPFLNKVTRIGFYKRFNQKEFNRVIDILKEFDQLYDLKLAKNGLTNVDRLVELKKLYSLDLREPLIENYDVITKKLFNQLGNIYIEK